MNSICYNLNEKFDFDRLTLGLPKSTQGGGYFSKILIDFEPFIVQFPKCKTKKGIIKTGKKTYCDLLLTDDNYIFLNWFQSLEKKIQQLIYEKRKEWFDNDITLDDIEYLFNSSLRPYKSNFSLIRGFLNNNTKNIKNNNGINIFDEEENNLTLEDLDKDKTIISIIEILGIKYTNGGTSFHLELGIKQIMVFSKSEIFKRCLIQRKNFNTKELDKKEDKNLDKEDKNLDKEDKNLDKEDKNLDKEDDNSDKEDENSDKEDENSDKEDENSDKESLEEDDNIDNKILKIHEKRQIDINPMKESLDELSEVQIKVSDNEKIKLRTKRDIYYELWIKAKTKAKEAKKKAIEAYLEAKKIKNTYLLDEIDSSDDELENSFRKSQ